MSPQPKISLLLIVLLAMGSIVFAQNDNSSRPASDLRNSPSGIGLQNGLVFPDYPLLILPESRKFKLLPSAADNSHRPFMRPIFEQKGASCGQSASVAYNFCYEINRLRNLSSGNPENQYPSHFTWNFMNQGGEGVSYFHSFEVLRRAGCPNEATFGPITLDDPLYWMSGYEKYYKAMHNRISAVHSIAVGTPEGLLTLKHWLFDHLNGSATGGVANFYTGVIGYTALPAGTHEGGKKVVTSWYPVATHALTIVGYDDSIRYDLNNDGLYTNTIDLNADGVIDIRDWEIGGVKFANSYNSSWADSGYCYALYSSLARKYGDGGIWNNTVHVIDADSAYSPLLTMKANIRYNARGFLRIRAGVSRDTSSTTPETILDFPVFNFQGGDHPMQGGYREEHNKIEIGLDISPLIGATIPGKASRFFLMIDENDPDNKGSGLVEDFSVISYSGSILEMECQETPFMISDNCGTLLSVVAGGPFNPPILLPATLPTAIPGSPYNCQLQASGGTAPFSWALKRPYAQSSSQGIYNPATGQKLQITDNESGSAMCILPFSFPFFGKYYDTLYAHTDGYLLFNVMNSPYPYLQDEDLFLQQQRLIAGCMSLCQKIGNADDGVWFSSDSKKVTFTWHLSMQNTIATGHSNFAVTMFKNGRIEFSYGDILIPTGVLSVIGISNGDGINSQPGEFSGRTEIANGLKTVFEPDILPESIRLDGTGRLNCDTIASDFSGDIIIQLTDKNKLSVSKTYNLSTGPETEPLYSAGTDRIINPGEDVAVSLKIRNTASPDIQGMEISLRSNDPTADIYDSVINQIQIASGEEIYLESVFRFRVSDSITSDHTLGLILTQKWSGRVISRYLTCRVVCPELSLSGPLVSDHENFRLDPGEKTTLLMRLSLQNQNNQNTFKGKLTSDDPYLSFTEPSKKEFTFTDLPGLFTAGWEVKANVSTPKGHIAVLDFTLYTPEGDSSLHNYKLTIGSPRILVIDLDKNNNSALHICSTMEQIGIKTETQPVIDSSLFGFECVFLSLGVRPYNHTLLPEEGQLLNSFLDQGGNLYMEGGATFGSDPQLPLHDKFQVTGQKLAWYKPPDTLIGDSSAFMRGIRFDYRGETIMTYNLVPEGRAISLFSDKHSGYHFTVANDSAAFHTIASGIEFGGIFPFDGPGREDIIRKYLGFFGADIEPLAANFRISKTEVCSGEPAFFEANPAGNPLSYHWVFEGGDPSESNNPTQEVHWDTPGIYPVRFTVTDSVSSNTLTRENLVTVRNCIGIPADVSATDICVYPNPASEFIVVSVNHPGYQILQCRLVDISGRIVMQSELGLNPAISQNKIELPALQPGVYILTLTNTLLSRNLKVIIQ